VDAVDLATPDISAPVRLIDVVPVEGPNDFISETERTLHCAKADLTADFQIGGKFELVSGAAGFQSTPGPEIAGLEVMPTEALQLSRPFLSVDEIGASLKNLWRQIG
jgi:hypothetical protein